MDLGMLGMFLVQTAGVLALLGIIVLMIDRVIK